MRLQLLLVAVTWLFACIGAGATGTATAHRNEVYSYEGFAGGRIEIHTAGAVILGDFGVNAKICSDQSKYFCVNAPGAFYFAVPKHFTNGLRTWKVDGHRYDVLSSTRWLMIMGVDVPVAIIATTSRSPNGDTATTYFYYSQKIGLIGFESRLKVPCEKSRKSNEDFPVLYLLNEKSGFGATN